MLYNLNTKLSPNLRVFQKKMVFKVYVYKFNVINYTLLRCFCVPASDQFLPFMKTNNTNESHILKFFWIFFYFSVIYLIFPKIMIFKNE